MVLGSINYKAAKGNFFISNTKYIFYISKKLIALGQMIFK